MKDAAMHAVNVSTLKNNPTQALQWAQTQPVVVMNRSTPFAMVVGMDSLPNDQTPHARMALAVSLFKDGGLSWMQAAKYAQCTASQFMKHLARLGIPIIDMSEEEVRRDMDTLAQWLAK
jgi:predicted HTH domain antitoxin